jgi:hypothetical protein
MTTVENSSKKKKHEDTSPESKMSMTNSSKSLQPRRKKVSHSKSSNVSYYVPAKLEIFGHHHPDPVFESLSLASIAPPDVSYELHLPYQIITTGLLSTL